MAGLLGDIARNVGYAAEGAAPAVTKFALQAQEGDIRSNLAKQEADLAVDKAKILETYKSGLAKTERTEQAGLLQSKIGELTSAEQAKQKANQAAGQAQISENLKSAENAPDVAGLPEGQQSEMAKEFIRSEEGVRPTEKLSQGDIIDQALIATGGPEAAEKVRSRQGKEESQQLRADIALQGILTKAEAAKNAADTKYLIADMKSEIGKNNMQGATQYMTGINTRLDALVGYGKTLQIEKSKAVQSYDKTAASDLQKQIEENNQAIENLSTIHRDFAKSMGLPIPSTAYKVAEKKTESQKGMLKFNPSTGKIE